MGTMNMTIYNSPHMIREIQKEFSQAYPFLRIEYAKKIGKPHIATPPPVPDDAENTQSPTNNLLWNEFAITDEMTVTELEVLLQYQFGLPLQILRKSGNLWMETRMTRHWTLRQQNDHGADIASSY